MSELIPIFPLPNVVLFPQVFLPLHILEPRYRAMVADALAGDRVIGMVLLKRALEDGVDGPPPVYAIGCSGLITHFERLSDGRYNIVLRGLERFSINAEDHALAYRRAQVTPIPEPTLTADDQRILHHHRSRLETLLAPAVGASSDDVPGASAMTDADLVNALAQYLDFEPLEKQALLERPCLRTRADALIELLEMRLLLQKTPGATRTAH